MIFCFASSPSYSLSFEMEQTDIFCFFHSQKSVQLSAEHWVTAVAASLKLKKNVLILERSQEQVPLIDPKQRWEVGTDYLWLAPRALSVLLQAAHQHSGAYSSVKTTLKSSK